MPRWEAISLPPLLLPAFGYFCFALAVGAAIPALLGTITVTDYETFYRPVGESIARGDGLRLPGGEPAVRYPPGFPLLVATQLPPRLLNALAMTGSAVLLFLIARGMAGERAGWIAAALWALYPPNWALLAAPFSEPSFSFLLYLALWLHGRDRGWSTGLALGLAMLIRPIAILLPLVFLTRRQALPILAACLLTILPWEIWAYQQTGRWIPLATSGAETLLDGLMLASNDRKGYRGPVALPDAARQVSLEVEAHARELQSPPDVAAFLLRQDPAGVTQLMAVKALRTWYATDSGRLEILLLALQAVIVALAAASWRRARRPDWRLLAVIVYFWAMTVAAYSMLRYMLPAMGLVLALAAVALQPRTPEHEGS